MNQDIEQRDDSTPVGTIYITGDSVDNGQVDLEKTVQYLKGLDKVLRYYVEKQNPELSMKKYSIEVRLRPGSLITDVMAIAGIGSIATIATVALGTYAKTALEEVAKNDIGDKSSKDIAKGAIKAVKTVASIAKHRGTMMLGKTFKAEETKVIDAENIVIVNHRGEELSVTKEELELYRSTPRNELRDMMTLVNKDTQLYIGDKPIDKDSIPDDAVSINFIDKRIFDDRDESIDKDVLFPELVQDSTVVLEGELTRGNGVTNTLGFSYCGRILKCVPYGGDSVKGYRDMLFGPVRIKAVVDRRSTAKGSIAQLKKPILRVIEIEKLEDKDDSKQIALI